MKKEEAVKEEEVEEGKKKKSPQKEDKSPAKERLKSFLIWKIRKIAGLG